VQAWSRHKNEANKALWHGDLSRVASLLAFDVLLDLHLKVLARTSEIILKCDWVEKLLKIIAQGKQQSVILSPFFSLLTQVD
jgi:hypothetical protein